MRVSGLSPLFNPPGGGQETRILISTPAGRPKAEETLITAMGILAGLVTFVTRTARPWEETLEAYTSRMKGIVQDINDNFCVSAVALSWGTPPQNLTGV